MTSLLSRGGTWVFLYETCQCRQSDSQSLQNLTEAAAWDL